MQHIKLRPFPTFCVASAGGSSQGGLKAAAQQQLALSAQDSMTQAKEREEVSELQDEVKKLREKAQVQILVSSPEKSLFCLRKLRGEARAH